MDIGKRIQQLREESNMLQAELAENLGLGRTTISNYEHAYSSPDLETLTAIAQLFHVSTDFLLGISNNRSNFSDTNKEQVKVLNYYERLNSENRDYINGEMIRLYREQKKKKFQKKTSDKLS